MNEIKLIVCDLDGTLLNDQKMISPYTEYVLRKVKEQGASICFASGRDEQMMSVYALAIGGCDYMLSDNGALVRDGQGTILHSDVLEEEDTAKILAYLNEHEMDFMMYSAERMYFSENCEKLKKRIRDYEELTERIGHPVKLQVREFLRTDSTTGYQNAAKIVAYEKDESRLLPYMNFLESLPMVHHESTGYGLEGAFHKRVSKKAALHHIMDHMGIGEEAVCVFGDYDNDLSMFDCAKYRICMENGVDELKAASTFVTKSNNEDGVAAYLADVFQIPQK